MGLVLFFVYVQVITKLLFLLNQGETFTKVSFSMPQAVSMHIHWLVFACFIYAYVYIYFTIASCHLHIRVFCFDYCAKLDFFPPSVQLINCLKWKL